MSEQVIHLLPTIPQSWEAILGRDGRFMIWCPTHYLDSAAKVPRLSTSSTRIHLDRLLRKRQVSSILPRWMNPDSRNDERNNPEATREAEREQVCPHQLVVSAIASRHVFVHDVKMTMRHNSFLLVGDLFHVVEFKRNDMYQTYFYVKLVRTGGALLSFYLVCDAFGVPVYYLRGFSTTKINSVKIVDAATDAEVCTMDQLGGGKRRDGLCIWRKSFQQPWVIVIANRQRTNFEFIEVGSDRVLLVVRRKSAPFAKICNLKDQFDIHIAPFVDTALASLWVMLTARSFCI